MISHAAWTIAASGFRLARSGATAERQRRRRELIVSVPLTQAGAVYLDEQAKAITLVGMLSVVGLLAEKRNSSGYLTPAELLEAVPG